MGGIARWLLIWLAITSPAYAKSQEAQEAIDLLFSIERSFFAGDPNVPAPIQAYNHCIVPKIQYGQFTSFDGGRSSLKLEAACQSEAGAVVDDCEKKGGGESNMCKATPAYLAQVALKLLNK